MQGISKRATPTRRPWRAGPDLGAHGEDEDGEGIPLGKKEQWRGMDGAQDSKESKMESLLEAVICSGIYWHVPKGQGRHQLLDSPECLIQRSEISTSK